MTDITESILHHSDILKSYAGRLTHDKEAAKDLHQETICRALANQGSFSRGTNIEAWMFTIMRNLFINGYRRKTREKKIFNRHYPDIALCSTPSDTPPATTRLEIKEIRSMIHAMPDILKIPIYLYCEGYKYQEIATIMDTAVGTTKSRIYLARQLLRKKTGHAV
jgi:RNA polymerase sigma-70 factor (ECF subfamily)